MDGLAFYLLALGALLTLSAFFSGSEAALFSLTRVQVRSMRSRAAAGQEVHRLLDKPRKLLITILIGNLLVNIFATSAATALMLGMFGEKGLGYAFLSMSLMIMLFGEIFPKAIALHWSERFALLVILPLRVFHVVVAPLRIPLSWFSDAVIDAVRRRVGQAKRSFTPEELVTAARISRSVGAVGLFEYELLSNILRFRETIVKEIMTPSIHVVSRSIRSERVELVGAFLESGLSRLPVYGETTDDILGVLHIKDIVDSRSARSEAELRALLREPLVIPETAAIDELYDELQSRKEHVAVVIDEYASFVGIVTIEDVLEELVGEIRDARDAKVEPVMRLDDKRIVVRGTTEIDEFNRVFGARLVDKEHETIAGFVIGRTGRIPREGEVIEAEGMRFHIISAEPNRIRKMRVEKS